MIFQFNSIQVQNDIQIPALDPTSQSHREHVTLRHSLF